VFNQDDPTRTEKGGWVCLIAPGDRGVYGLRAHYVVSDDVPFGTLGIRGVSIRGLPLVRGKNR